MIYSCIIMQKGLRPFFIGEVGMQDFVARNYRLLAILALAVVLAIIGSFGSLIASSVLPSRDETAIRQLCQDAVMTQQTLPMPPGSYKGGVMSAALLQQMEDKVTPTLGNYYTGVALTTVTKLVQQAIQNERDGKTRYLGGGLDSMSFSQVAVKNTTATAMAQAVVWEKLSQTKGKKTVLTTPRRNLSFSFALVKINGHWFIKFQSLK